MKPVRQKTFFGTVKPSLSSPVFTADLKYRAPGPFLYLQYSSLNPNKSLGTYDFGTINPAKYTGAITYVNAVTTNGFWEFTGSGYAVGSGSFVS